MKGEGNGIEGEIWGCLDGKERKIKKAGEREREGERWKTREGKRRREFGSDIDVEGSAAFVFFFILFNSLIHN